MEKVEGQENIGRGIFFILLSSLGFALMGMFVRLSGDLPFMQKSLFRNSIAFVVGFSCLCVSARKDKSAWHVEKAAWKFIFLRSALGSFGIFGNFYAIDRMNISDAAMLNKMSPFFSLLASFIILGEKPTWINILSLVTAFTGALFVLKPSLDFAAFSPYLVGLVGGAGAGFAYAFVRKIRTYNVNGYIIISFFSLFSTLIALPFAIADFHPMTLFQVLCLLGAGASASLGQFGITWAYYNASSRRISVYEYSQIIFSALLGFAFFGQIPDVWSIIGYVVIIGTAVAVFINTNGIGSNGNGRGYLHH